MPPVKKGCGIGNAAFSRGGTIKQIALKAAFRAVKCGGVITEAILRELCEFELGNNMVGFRKKAAQIGFAKKESPPRFRRMALSA